MSWDSWVQSRIQLFEEYKKLLEWSKTATPCTVKWHEAIFYGYLFDTQDGIATVKCLMDQQTPEAQAIVSRANNNETTWWFGITCPLNEVGYTPL